jgi:hypothetical protein
MRRTGRSTAKTPTFISVLLAAIFTTGLAQRAGAESWRGIVPLRSTLADVTRLLGKPFETLREGVRTYRTETEFITIYTTRGDGCRSEDHFWEVPDGTVSEIAVGWPRGSKMLSDSGYVLSEFELIRENTRKNDVTYVDRNRGVTLYTEGEYLLSVHFLPNAADRREFACSAKRSG